MERLAGELADIVHLASFFVNAGHHRENLEHVRAGAERAGRRMGSFEIDFSMPCSVSDDRAAARRAAKRPAAQGILWTAAAERYSRDRKDWIRPTLRNLNLIWKAPVALLSKDQLFAVTGNQYKSEEVKPVAFEQVVERMRRGEKPVRAN